MNKIEKITGCFLVAVCTGFVLGYKFGITGIFICTIVSILILLKCEQVI